MVSLKIPASLLHSEDAGKLFHHILIFFLDILGPFTGRVALICLGVVFSFFAMHWLRLSRSLAGRTVPAVMTKRFHLLPLVFLAICGICLGEGEPDDTEIGQRLFSGDLSVIDELAAIGSPDAIDKLHMMVVQFRRKPAADDHPDIRLRALEALRSIDGAEKNLADRIREMSQRGVPKGGRQTLLRTLKDLRTEEAVREVGELLFDDFDADPEYKTLGNRGGTNDHLAGDVFFRWMQESPDLPFSSPTEAIIHLKGTEIWKEWWQARKDDPEMVRAIVENRPLPPLKPAAAEGE
ncbi:MAG: hypothetical protein ACI8UO_004312 [Verrucomicrobiales bacterium]|jgi:hypothetical protein